MKKLLLGIGVGIGVVTALSLAPIIDFEPVNTTSAANEPAKTELPERIPFTNKDVTPGDPESYIGTYGQCPFYENAMEKGCYPPSDIVCNEDWTKCEPKKENEGNNVEENTSDVRDTRSTESQEEQSNGSCSSK